MATVPRNFITQTSKTNDVSITYDGQDDSPGEKLWLATYTPPETVVDTKSVVTNQQDRDVLEARIVAAGEAAYTDLDLYATEGIGVASLDQPLTLIGDGAETLTVANGETEALDLSAFVAGGYQPLTYTIDTDTSETGNGTYAVAGSVLQATWGSAGSDSVVVDIADRDGTTVTVTVAVTLSA